MFSLFCVVVCVLAQLIKRAVHPAAILLRKRSVVGFIECRVTEFARVLQSRGKKREIEMAVFLSRVPNFLIRFSVSDVWFLLHPSL